MTESASRAGRLELIAFLSGAVVMVLEITGSRVMAPFLGTSVFVWTTLIGIIMASLSMGYWWGGRLADQAPTQTRLAGILFLACLFATATAVMQHSFLTWLQSGGFEIRLGALLATLVLFAPASTMLGMVTPYVVRLKLTAIEHSGADVGRLYAISTAGSIVGTFACGYFLLSWVGTGRILYGLSLLLLGLSFIAAVEYRPGHRAATAVFLLLMGGLAEYETRQRAAGGFLDLDTAYQRVQVIDATDPRSGRPMRVLKAEEANTQSAIYLDGNEILSDYLYYFELARYTGAPLRRVLTIGAAGCVHPMHLHREVPGISIDVVEIDPAMTQIAQRHFQFVETAQVRLFHEDGRTFVNRVSREDPGVYDAIFIDAFQTRVPPFQLLTREFVEGLERLLAPGGLVALNLIARTDSPEVGLAPAVFSTFAEVLPAVAAFEVEARGGQETLRRNPKAPRNLVLFVARKPLSIDFPAWSDRTGRMPPRPLAIRPSRDLILHDDFAPVEHLVSVR